MMFFSILFFFVSLVLLVSLRVWESLLIDILWFFLVKCLFKKVVECINIVEIGVNILCNI